jgi:putative membrane protein
MYRVLLTVLLLIVLCVGAAVGYFNAQTIRFDYLAGQVELPLIALVVAEFIVAVLLTLIVCSTRIFSLKAEARRLRRQLADAEAELKTLRAIPINESPLKDG